MNSPYTHTTDEMSVLPNGVGRYKSKLSYTHQSSYSFASQVLYPSYIFVYMKLNEVSYTAIQTVQKVSSFVGPRKPIKGTYGMSIVVPKRLTDKEITTFEGLVEATSVMSQKDQHAFEFEIGEMVVVIDGPHKGETGAVRMVRDGQLVVRFYTYGTMIDTYLDPKVIRKMTDEEAEKGLGGPEVRTDQKQSAGLRQRQYKYGKVSYPLRNFTFNPSIQSCSNPLTQPPHLS